LSEANNTYRTLCSTFALLLALKGYEKLSNAYTQIRRHDATLLLVALALMFLFAHRKQSGYVSKRVECATPKPDEVKGKAATA
jgi:hypothetical protein